MRPSIVRLVLVPLIAASLGPALAHAATRGAPAAGRTPAAALPGAPSPRALERLLRAERIRERSQVRARARFFSKITLGQDFRGERVLVRNEHVTAFLDMSDPEHPRYSADAPVEKEARAIPADQRAHVLVVPNQPREHIGKRLGSTITHADLAATMRVVEEARGIARQLGIRNARVYINPSERLMIGYLHVHIVGRRDPSVPYPRALRSPTASRRTKGRNPQAG
jgi:diadenosine tetraphosphate (Ap4A) HIT family hydrolase